MKIAICNLNQELEGTCGSCIHTDNNLGIVALHCDMYVKHKKKIASHGVDKENSKVRSWEKKCKYYRRNNETTTKTSQ